MTVQHGGGIIKQHACKCTVYMTHNYQSKMERCMQACIHRRARTQTRGLCSRHPPEHGGGRETVMDYRHIWAVISRSHIPPAFNGRQESCIMVSHRRPATLGCLVSVHVSITSFLYLLRGAECSAPHRPFFCCRAPNTQIVGKKDGKPIIL